MQETVTVEDAIKKGHKMLTYPANLISIINGVIFLFLVINTLVSIYLFLFGLFFGFVLGRLYWLIRVPQWKIWAFENVRNVHELKKRAIRERLIYHDGTTEEKFEYWTARTKQKWKNLERKFEQEDLFIDDPTIPSETIIYYSKQKNFIQMVLMISFVGFGIYIIITMDNFMGYFPLLIGIYFGYTKYKKATNREPQITLNEKGIKTISTDFYDWSEIASEEVILKDGQKHAQYYLVYNYPGGVERLKINEYDTNQYTLNKLLVLYRGRFANTITNS